MGPHHLVCVEKIDKQSLASAINKWQQYKTSFYFTGKGYKKKKSMNIILTVFLYQFYILKLRKFSEELKLRKFSEEFQDFITVKTKSIKYKYVHQSKFTFISN